VFIETKDDGSGGENWTIGAINRAKLQSNHHQQTNTQFFNRPDALPVAQPTMSKNWREISHSMDLLPQVHLEIFQLCLWPLTAPGYLGEGCHASHQPSDANTPIL